ncbi:MAG: glycosyl transferase family 36 [Rhodanobacter sp.]|nr:MAG: glycosyl transferase family 36 [Rhodanobacter sp.]
MAMPSPCVPQPPRHHLLSNGRYHVMLSSNGGGYSRREDLAITRWREDPTADSWGSYLLLRDEEDASVWSATRQPFGRILPDDAVAFQPGRAVFSRRHHSLHSRLDVAVAHDADIELRRLTLSNHGDRTRVLSITSFAELVLGPAAADNAHPAFSKMFVQTEFDARRGLLLATRRRRSDDEPTVWAAHALQVEELPASVVHEYETDRARFLGRGRTLTDAASMQAAAALSGTTGCVLDPVFSLRQQITLAPGSSVRMLCWTCVADSRDGALALSAQFDKPHAAELLFADAAAHAENLIHRLELSAARLACLTPWLDALLSSDLAQRAAPDALARGRGGSPTLWPAGISGDRPIILLRLRSKSGLPRLQELLLAQRCWREQGLAVDVVLLNTAGDVAADDLQHAVDPLLSAHKDQLKAGDHGPLAELFSLRNDAIGDELRDGLQCVARVVLDEVEHSHAGDFARPAAERPAAIRAGTAAASASMGTATVLEFANGLGGFDEAGRVYRIELDDDRHTPAPWVNVIANPVFGFVVSAEGGGYAWSQNSQQNPLTPWPNDPVSDTPHDVIYLRDHDNGALWSATALPIRVADAHYAITHGKGWSRFENDAHGIALELTQCVPPTDTIKLSRLRLRNGSAHTRRLSITGYVEWALGPNGSTPAPFVVTARDASTGALLARNRWRADFGERVAFFDAAGQQHAISGDRTELLGPLGSVKSPMALQHDAPLSGRIGAGLDPCGALQTSIELPPQTQIELVFLLGDAADEDAARALIGKYRTTGFDQVLADLDAQWRGTLDTVQVHTPHRAMDILLNDWLLYQVTACRLWARTAYYQASGAYGFRDQLQDVMALCASRPELTREHLLRAAGRQFAEGDVQHWWLPPNGQGIRTRISDDRIWLAHVAMHYVEVSGDRAVLDEQVPFLTGQVLADDASDAFFQPQTSDQQVSLYEHCARAIDSSLAVGAHALPLIGTGDWNDGMNAVGAKGRGESTWLGWLLLTAIDAMTPLAEQRAEAERAVRWRTHADALRQALEQAWDGEWYRRGYYDDGTPLGSRDSTQCRIDTIAQSWSVIAGATDRAHSARAMEAVDRLLVDHDHGIARLFTPPFDQDGRNNPGYIKGYPPGVRENGGQYTHGAIWSIFAWAGLGEGDRAAGLFDLLNPIKHSDHPAAVQRYMVEPYVVSADVYSVAPHVGRGGWTWYTGSAAWLYRAGLESILGFQLRGDRLRIDPCIPRDWPGFELNYRYRGTHARITTYAIEVANPERVCRGVTAVEMDGQTLDPARAVALLDDGKTHKLRVVLG